MSPDYTTRGLSNSYPRTKLGVFNHVQFEASPHPHWDNIPVLQQVIISLPSSLFLLIGFSLLPS
jgi:hypothetical protein